MQTISDNTSIYIKNIDNNITSKSKILFSFWFAISFILNGYSSGIPGISLGSIVFIFYSILSIIKLINCRGKKIIDISPILLSLVFLIITSIAITTVLDASVSGVLIGISKLFIWAIMISVVSSFYVDYLSLLKALQVVGTILTIYIFLQTLLFYGFHIYLPNIFSFGFLKPYDEGYAAYESFINSAILRPGSLLSESSFYGNYIICTLTLTLWGPKKHRLSLSILYSIGIVVSSSTSAIVCLIIIFFWYLLISKKNKRVCSLILIFFITLFLFPLIFNYKEIFSHFGLFGNSLIYAFDKFLYMDNSSRLGKSFNYLDFIHGINQWIGVGYGNESAYLKAMTLNTNIYLNSVTSILVGSGYVGVFAFTVFVIGKFFRMKDECAKILLLVYLIKGFASGIYFSTYGILFMFLIIYRTKYSSNEYLLKIRNE